MSAGSVRRGKYAVPWRSKGRNGTESSGLLYLVVKLMDVVKDNSSMVKHFESVPRFELFTGYTRLPCGFSKVGRTRRKIRIKLLKCANLGVARALFGP